MCLSDLKQAHGVFRGLQGDFLYADSLLFRYLSCDIWQITAFVPFTAVGDRGEIWGICLKKYPFQGNVLNGFGYRCFLEGDYASDADVPVSEPGYPFECLPASGEGMEYASWSKLPAALKYAYDQLGG